MYVKDYLVQLNRTARVRRPGFFKRILSSGKPVGVARSFAKAYIKANGNLPQILKARYPEWSYEKVKQICDWYPNIYDLTYYIISTEWNLESPVPGSTNSEVVSSILVGFSEIGLIDYLELNNELDSLIKNSRLGKDVTDFLNNNELLVPSIEEEISSQEGLISDSMVDSLEERDLPPKSSELAKFDGRNEEQLVDRCLQELETVKKDAYYYYKLGSNLKEEKNYLDAIKYYKKAVEISAVSIISHSIYRYCMELKKYDEAITCLQDFLKDKPSSPLIRYDLGCLFFLKEEYDNAIEQFLKVLDILPSSNEKEMPDEYSVIEKWVNEDHFVEQWVIFYDKLDLLLQRDEASRDRTKEIKDIVEVGFDLDRMHWLMGACYAGKKDFANAIEQFERTVQINPIYASAHKMLAIIYFQVEKRLDLARKHGNIYKLIEKLKIPSEDRKIVNILVLGKKRGFLTYEEISNILPPSVSDKEQIDYRLSLLDEIGIEVVTSSWK